jgi:D-tyrosyl-tRNA(Tyr) deacylase
MRAVIQRVMEASVEVDGKVIGRIGHGLVVLLGVAKGDDESDVRSMADKLGTLRIFADAQGKMNRSLTDAHGQALIVSQFTLLGETAKGRRPGFDGAAAPDLARRLYEQVVAEIKAQGIPVETGVFGAYMIVSLRNDGPVTFVLDTRSSMPPVHGEGQF